MAKIGRNDPCWCGSGKKFKKCHGRVIHVMPPPPRGLQILSAQELPKMRRSCQLAARVLRELGIRVQPGVSTLEINDLATDLILEAGAYPSSLNYPKGCTDPRNPVISPGGFPKSICTSVNEVVCHGIPSADCVLKQGDIVNLDVTVTLDGYFGDTSATFYVGDPGEDTRRVVETARKSLELGIQAAKPRGQLMDVGEVIYRYASTRHCSVVKDYTGHGVGRVFHAEPQVCHYPNPDTNCQLVPGMTFTIEPMINLGTWRTELDPRDHWTVYTKDRQLSAQFEHTIMITDSGVEVLTGV